MTPTEFHARRARKRFRAIVWLAVLIYCVAVYFGSAVIGLSLQEQLASFAEGY